MKAFNKTVKKRIDEEVFEVHRHGIVHGSVVNFDNVVVATKAWNMLFAVADWAQATDKAAEPPPTPTTWGTLWSQIQRHSHHQRYRDQFVPSELAAGDADFNSYDVVARANGFLKAWQHQRWGLVAEFAPPPSGKTAKQSAADAKRLLQRDTLTAYTIQTVKLDVASAAEIQAQVQLNGNFREVRFRMVLYTPDGELGLPCEPEASWYLATWMPPCVIEPAIDASPPSNTAKPNPASSAPSE